jgi:hypothetical protein
MLAGAWRSEMPRVWRAAGKSPNAMMIAAAVYALALVLGLYGAGLLADLLARG